MSADPFENRLAATPLRELPPAWRARVLTAAEESRFRFRDLLWPHPVAWGVLAACWLLIATLHLAGPRERELYAFAPPGMPPPEITTERYFAYLRGRDLLLANEPEPLIWDRSKL